MGLAQRIRAGETLVGTFVKSNDPNVVEALAVGGFEFLIADVAHSALGVRDVEGVVRAAALHDVPVLARLAPADLDLAGRLLETGAVGIQVTDVDDPTLLGAIRAATSFGPRGTRGLSLSHRAGSFGLAPAAKFIDREVVVVAQLESRRGLASLAGLLSTPTPPDAWFIGPTDLALDLGFRGAAAHPEVTTAILAALAAIRAQGAATGIAAADGAAAREWQKRGVGMVAVASDLNLLARAARETVGRR